MISKTAGDYYLVIFGWLLPGLATMLLGLSLIRKDGASFWQAFKNLFLDLIKVFCGYVLYYLAFVKISDISIFSVDPVIGSDFLSMAAAMTALTLLFFLVFDFGENFR